MPIIATAPVPAGNRLNSIQTVPLPKVRNGHRKPEPPAATPDDLSELERFIGQQKREIDDRLDELEAKVEDLHKLARVFADAGVAETIIRRATTAAPEPAPVWPPKSCPSWCMSVDDPGSHAYHGQHPDDRTHVHAHDLCGPVEEPDLPSSVPLSLERQWSYGTPDAPRWTPQRVSVELSQHYRAVEPVLRVNHVQGIGAGSSYDMTLTEAAELIELLTHLVELGRRG